MSATPRRIVALLAALLLVAGCKPPRAPREAAQGSVTGTWTATSHPIDPQTGREGEGDVSWRFDLEERAAGKLGGHGSAARGRDSARFALDGVRGESDLVLKFDLDGEPATFRGSVMGVDALVGEVEVAGGKATMALTRR